MQTNLGIGSKLQRKQEVRRLGSQQFFLQRYSLFAAIFPASELASPSHTLDDGVPGAMIGPMRIIPAAENVRDVEKKSFRGATAKGRRYLAMFGDRRQLCSKLTVPGRIARQG